MKILHVCLSCFYIDDSAYQENLLVRQNVQDGHTVLVLASTESLSENGSIHYVEPGHYTGSDGAEVVRVPYRKILPHWVMSKLRTYRSVREHLNRFDPDVILFHGTCAWELLTFSKYVSSRKQVHLFVDSHEDWNNSARNFLSRELLHKMFYRPVLRSALPQIKKILCISTECRDFVRNVYGVPNHHLELFPLGGRPVGQEEYAERRNRKRRQLGLSGQEVLIVQSGKFTGRKKLLEALTAFSNTHNDNLKFAISGEIFPEILADATRVILNDKRILNLGWNNTEELTDLLCAADLYVQPGTQSVTMQHSLCCHCAVAIADTPSHDMYFCDNGWKADDQSSLADVFSKLNRSRLSEMGENSYQFSCENLDYAKLAARITIEDAPA